jgi:hypothetical protein
VKCCGEMRDEWEVLRATSRGGGDRWRGWGLVLIVGHCLCAQALGEEFWGGVFCELKGMLIEGMRVDTAGGGKLESALGFGRGLRGRIK